MGSSEYSARYPARYPAEAPLRCASAGLGGLFISLKKVSQKKHKRHNPLVAFTGVLGDLAVDESIRGDVGQQVVEQGFEVAFQDAEAVGDGEHR